jgi:hypothetical protein
MKEYEVWLEGFSATGERGPAHLCGIFRAETFANACYQWVCSLPEIHRKFFRVHKNNQLTYWGCRFFDNEKDARKSFG